MMSNESKPEVRPNPLGGLFGGARLKGGMGGPAGGISFLDAIKARKID